MQQVFGVAEGLIPRNRFAIWRQVEPPKSRTAKVSVNTTVMDGAVCTVARIQLRKPAKKSSACGQGVRVAQLETAGDIPDRLV